jgi:hypothetical protein
MSTLDLTRRNLTTLNEPTEDCHDTNLGCSLMLGITDLILEPKKICFHFHSPPYRTNTHAISYILLQTVTSFKTKSPCKWISTEIQKTTQQTYRCTNNVPLLKGWKWECVCRPEWPNTVHDFNSNHWLTQTVMWHASLYYQRHRAGDSNLSRHSSRGNTYILVLRRVPLLEYRTPANADTILIWQSFSSKLFFYNKTHHT